jgi:hypothetical protein
VQLAGEVDDDLEVHDLDVLDGDGCAEDRRDLEAQHLPRGRDDALALGRERQPGHEVPVLPLGGVEVGLQGIGVGPGPGERALEQVEEPEAVLCLEEYVAKRRGEQRLLALDAGPVPGFQCPGELVGGKGSGQLHVSSPGRRDGTGLSLRYY